MDQGEAARQQAEREYVGRPTPVLSGNQDDDWRVGWE
jgi:hypothetical protein